MYLRILYVYAHMNPHTHYAPYTYLQIHTHRIDHSHNYICAYMNYGEGNGNPLQYSSLENPVDRRAWWAAVHRVIQSWIRLKGLSMYACMHWRRKWQPTPVFLPGEPRRWRSLMGCRLWGRTESDTTEVT